MFKNMCPVSPRAHCEMDFIFNSYSEATPRKAKAGVTRRGFYFGRALQERVLKQGNEFASLPFLVPFLSKSMFFFFYSILFYFLLMAEMRFVVNMFLYVFVFKRVP